MIDSIDVMNTLETVIQPNIKMILIICIIIILAARNLETNVIIIISILIYIFIYCRQISFDVLIGVYYANKVFRGKFFINN